MNSSFTSLLTGGRGVSCFLIGVGFAVTANSGFAMSRLSRSLGLCPSEPSCPSIAQIPYLAAVGVVPLRFAPPPAPATARPAPVHVETTPVAVTPIAPVVAPSESHPVATDPVPALSKVEATPPAPKPVSILPDDTPRSVRPEDVLPYFQMPHNADTSNAPLPFAPPAPATVPPSSATYELK